MAFIPAIIASVGTSVASVGATVGGALGVAGPMTFGSSFALGAASIGAAGFLGSSLLSGGQQQMPSMSTPAAPTYADANEAGREESLDLLRKKRAGTTLTTPQGLLSTSDTTSKTLLGS